MYNSLIIKHFSAPLNVGELTEKDHEIHVGNPVCDDRVVLHVKLAEDGKRIAAVKYRAYGCATSIATASIFSEFIGHKTVPEVLATPDAVKKQLLGELEPNQVHCYEILDQLFAGLHGLLPRAAASQRVGG